MSDDRTRPAREAAPTRSVSPVAGTLALVTGALVFVGWLVGAEDITRLAAGYPQTKANTALALIALGAAVLLLGEGRGPGGRRAGRGLALIVAAFGCVVVGEYALGPVGIDEALFADPGPTPGRPAPHTAAALILLGFGLAGLDARVGGRNPATWLLGGAAAVVLSALLGYAYEVDFLRATEGTTGVGLPTVFALTAVTTGAAFLRPDRGLVAYLRRADSGAATARRLLPAVVVLPIVFGLARLWSEELGLDREVATGLTALVTMTTFVALVLLVSTRLSAADGNRVRAEAATAEALTRYRALLEATPDPTFVVDDAGIVVHVNRLAEQTFGYEPGELDGCQIEQLLPERLRDAHRGHRATFARNPHARPMGQGLELNARRRDGGELPVEISLNPVRTRTGRLVIAALRDVSERRRAEARLRDAARFFDVSHDLLCTATLDGRFQELNGAWETTLGWSLEELRARPFLEFVHPDDAEATAREVAALGAREISVGFVNRYRTKGGGWRWLEWNATVASGDGVIYASARDITLRRLAEAARRQAEEQFTQAFEHAPIGMAMTALDGRFISVNPALCELTGYSPAQLCDTNLQSISHPDDARAVVDARRSMMSGAGGRYHGEAHLISADGTPIPVEVSMTLIRSGDGPSHFVVQAVDMSERKRFEGQLQYLADHDPLTGLFNRRRFTDELTRELAVAARYNGSGALLAFDLDHFKYVNDSLGHSVGDELITRVATLVRRRLRETDVFARLGGDEFAVVLPRVDRQEALLVAAQLLAAIRRDGQLDDGRRVTASIGVAMFDATSITAEELLVEADIAMYDAKEAGRDRVAIVDPTVGRHERMHARLTWADRIRLALEHDGFVLHAQPILGLNGDRVPRYELLIRMRGEDGDLIPPGTFLYIAERFGMIQEIDRWALRETIRLLVEQQRAGRDVRFEMNLSAKSVTDPAMLTLVEEELRASGADPCGLCIEVTESAAIVNVDRAKLFARRLRELGCTFALDDFGAGFASFYYLKHLEFDYLKIDGEFIQGLPDSRVNQLVVRSLVQIANGLGKRTIAEFVGDEATLELLRRYGVDYAQGYHIARPGPIAADEPGRPASLPLLERVD